MISMVVLGVVGPSIAEIGVVSPTWVVSVRKWIMSYLVVVSSNGIYLLAVFLKSRTLISWVPFICTNPTWPSWLGCLNLLN